MKGESYNELKACYVIFICMFDFCGKGEAVYRFKMRDAKNNLSLNDGRYTIILNAGCTCEKVPDELKTFFDYLNDRIIVSGKDAFVEDIHREVLKHNRGKELIALMTLEEELKIRYNRGREDGRREAMIETAKTMKADGISVEVICKYTGLTEEEINKL